MPCVQVTNEGAGNFSGRDAESCDRPEHSDDTLIEGIAAGDARALEMLYARHRARVCRFAMRIVGSLSTAEEIVNEVFLQAWRQAASFEGRSRVSTWLIGIARHKALSALRRRSDLQLDEDDAASLADPADAPTVAADREERSVILQDCLARLSPRHRQVIDLIYFQGKKLEEAARFAGVPTNTMKSRVFYARNEIASLLTQAGVDRSWACI